MPGSSSSFEAAFVLFFFFFLFDKTNRPEHKRFQTVSHPVLFYAAVTDTSVVYLHFLARFTVHARARILERMKP